jgi:hypothetical protein
MFCRPAELVELNCITNDELFIFQYIRHNIDMLQSLQSKIVDVQRKAEVLEFAQITYALLISKLREGEIKFIRIALEISKDLLLMVLVLLAI